MEARVLKFLGTLLLLALIVLAIAGYVVYAPYGPSSETFVDIAPGTGSKAIAAQLERNGIIRNRFGFDLLRLTKGGTLKAGEYRFDHAVPMPDVYARLLRGDVYTRTLTIPASPDRGVGPPEANEPSRGRAILAPSAYSRCSELRMSAS